jgi:DNA-binding transcriptional ArsR family regulator
LTSDGPAFIFNRVVEHQSEVLSKVFFALSDPTRRSMLALLEGGERSVTELAEPFRMSFAGAAKHVRVLEDAGLVGRRWEGRVGFCRLEAERLETAGQWIARYRRFWETRLDTLERMLIAEAADKKATRKEGRRRERSQHSHDAGDPPHPPRAPRRRVRRMD